MGQKPSKKKLTTKPIKAGMTLAEYLNTENSKAIEI